MEMNRQGSSRTFNTSRNITSGIINRMVFILLPFINRTVILWILGAEYVGLSSLFASVLQVLNISELGFNTAIVYSLYRPIADHNEEEINRLLSLLKKIYHIVGIVVFGLGLLLMPFLRFFINGTYPDSINLQILFSLYLINSGISYFLFAYKETILIADQHQNVTNNIRTIVHIGVCVIQFVLLLVFKNYYLYLIITIAGTVLTNLMIARATKKRYPYLHNLSEPQAIPKSIKKQVSGLLIDRICDTCRNSFDSLIISSTLGLVATGIYGNYYYIYGALYGIMLVICNSMGASVGNSIATKTSDENFEDMRKFSMIFAYILGVCTICLLCLYQPFMYLWAGQNLMLKDMDMILFCIYFYIINMNNIRNQYISGTGIWWHLKLSYILEAAGNLVLNIILGKLLGITGIILATIITIFIFNYFTRNHILFHSYFGKEKKKTFYLEQFAYAGVTFVVAFAIYWICGFLPGNGIISILLRGVCSLICSSVLLLMIFRLFPEYEKARLMILNILKLFKRRISSIE